MGRRAAELAGGLVASVLFSFVTALALAQPENPVLYVIGAIVPLALLMAYWFWVEPRADTNRLRARRLHQALEDSIEHSFRASGHAADEAVPDSVRRAAYERLDIADLFEANHTVGFAVLRARADAGRALLQRFDADAETDTALASDIDAWELDTSRDLGDFRDQWAVHSFADPPIRTAPDVVGAARAFEAKDRVPPGVDRAGAQGSRRLRRIGSAAKSGRSRRAARPSSSTASRSLGRPAARFIRMRSSSEATSTRLPKRLYASAVRASSS